MTVINCGETWEWGSNFEMGIETWKGSRIEEALEMKQWVMEMGSLVMKHRN